MDSPVRKPFHRKGIAVLQAYGNDSAFAQLSYTYPLKLLSPKIQSGLPVSILYILSYGGGLVSEDCVELDITVEQGATLVCLTQGSTKVFRARALSDRARASSINLSAFPSITTQKLNVTIAPSAFLLLLPDAITCFAGASYKQTQVFHLQSSQSSAVLLDWFTSGRMSRGEEWLFDRYQSINEVFVDGKRVIRDVMLLENPALQKNRGAAFPLAERPLKDRLAPYSCYATVFILGPLAQTTLSALEKEYASITQFQAPAPPPFIWSFSTIQYGQGSKGGVVRVAAKETETVKFWLKKILAPLSDVVGSDVFGKILV